jgi:primosomal protein N''
MDPAFQKKVDAAQEAQQDMLDALDKSRIRPMQKASLLKMAACTDLASRGQIDQCMQKAQIPMTVAQSVVNQELGQFQQRLDRCMLDCQDSVKDSNFKSDDARDKAFYSCASTCVDKNMSLIKSTLARIEKEIDSKIPK